MDSGERKAHAQIGAWVYRFHILGTRIKNLVYRPEMPLDDEIVHEHQRSIVWLRISPQFFLKRIDDETATVNYLQMQMRIARAS